MNLGTRGIPESELELWDKIEKEALEFLGPRPKGISPDIYYKAVSDLIKHTLKLRSLVLPEVGWYEYGTHFADCSECSYNIFESDRGWEHCGGTPPQDHVAQPQE